MSKTLESISLLEILPPNLRNDEKINAAAQSLDQELHLATQAVCECLLLPRLEELPEAVLDSLAWQWHVDFYDPFTLPVRRKRDLIRESIHWHRIKGTPEAVEKVVAAAYGNCELTEWYEYGGKPFYFNVAVTLEEESTDKNWWKNVIAAINSVKNTRSWLEKISFNYPPIHLPITIHHRAKCQHTVDAYQKFWNLGSVRTVRRDGEFLRNGTTRRTGKHPDENYKDRQTHRAEIDLFVESTMNGSRITNRRDGKHCRDGSHRRNGTYETGGMVSHCCTIITKKNGIEVIEYV